MNFKQSVEYIKKHHTKSNEHLLLVYNHFFMLETEGAWKKKRFYSSDEQAKPYINLSFGRFLKEAYGFSQHWYMSMKKIMELKDGKDLFLKHGRENMVTYVNSTPEERIAILKYAETAVATRSFSGIRNALFPAAKPEVVADVWKQKYDKLLERYKVLEKRFEKYKRETAENIKVLKRTITILAGKEQEESKPESKSQA